VPSGEDKATLAGELAAFHSEYVGVPKNRGHIVFQGYAPGSGFAAGEVAAQR
jgi:phenylpyruvate tautomerase PptA (4-oxalocrotonate tautomerase family)